jgi:hypothetical protein
MRKTKVGNIEIIIDPQENDRMMFVDTYLIDDSVIIDRVKRPIPCTGEMKINCESTTTIIKEPGRARKIFNSVKRVFLSWLF